MSTERRPGDRVKKGDLLMGIGYYLCPATMQGGEILGARNLIGLFLVKADGALIDNMAILFAIKKWNLKTPGREDDDIEAEKKAELVVVGNPVNMDGTEGDRSEKCRELAKLLETEYGLKTDMMDERLTTVEAHRALNVTNTRGKDRKAVIDAVSAVIILEDYIKQHKS